MARQEREPGDDLISRLVTDYVATGALSRETAVELAFGFGVHQCIGQNLARTELQIALATLARRLPGLRLAVPAEELRFQYQQEIYGIDELPVTW